MSTSGRQPRHITLMTSILVALLLALPLLRVVRASEPVEEKSSVQSVVPETGEAPTATMAPPTPTPTQAVVTPTATIPPSPTPTSTQEVVTPTATPTSTATTTPTATSTPEPTATATPLPNTDSITATTETSGIVLQPGEEREISFSYQVTTPRTSTVIHAELRADDGTPATGWTLRGQAGDVGWTGSGASVDLTESATTTPGSAFTLTLAIQAPLDATEEQTVSLFVSSTATTSAGAIEVRIAGGAPNATMTVVPAADMGLSKDSGFSVQSVSNGGFCTQNPPASDVVKPPNSVLFTCTVSKTLLENVLDLKLMYRIRATSVSPTWESQVVDKTGFSGSDKTVSEGLLSGLVSGVSEQIRLAPTSSTPAENEGSVIISIQACLVVLFGNCTGGWQTVGNTTTLTARTPPLCNPTVSLTTDIESIALVFEPSTWDGDSYRPVDGTLNMNIAEDTRSVCSGLTDNWDVDMQMSGLDQDVDTGTGFHIPQSAITWQSIVSNGGGTNTTTPPLTLNSNSIASGNTSNDALGSWDINFKLQPPNTAPADDYSGTITVTIGNSGP